MRLHQYTFSPLSILAAIQSPHGRKANEQYLIKQTPPCKNLAHLQLEFPYCSPNRLPFLEHQGTKEERFYYCMSIGFPLLLKTKNHILYTDILLSGVSQLSHFSYTAKRSHKCIQSDSYCMSLEHLETDSHGQGANNNFACPQYNSVFSFN